MEAGAGAVWEENTVGLETAGAAEQSEYDFGSIFFYNAMLGHTHYEKLEVCFATYSSIL